MLIAIGFFTCNATEAKAESAPLLVLDDIHWAVNLDQYLVNLGEYTLDNVPEDLSLYKNNLSDEKADLDLSANWYRLRLYAPPDSTAKWFISTALVQAPLLRAFSVSNNRIIKLIDVDKQSSFTDRPLFYRVLVIPIDTPQDQVVDVYFQYRSIAKFAMYPHAIAEHRLEKRNNLYEMINGMAFGATLVLLLFFLAQFLIKPSRALGVYCLLVMSVGFFIAQMTGYNFQYLWPESGSFNIRFSASIGGMTYICYFLFTLTLFELKTEYRKFYYLLLMVTGIAALFSILGLFFDVSYYLVFFALVSLPLPVIVGIRFFSKQKYYAIFFLLGAIIHCSTALLFSLTVAGVDLGVNRYVFSLVGVGQLLDIGLFAAALIYQSKKVQDDLNLHLQLKLKDAEALAQAEKEKSKSLAKLQDYNLQLAAITHDLTQPLASLKMTLSVVDDKQSGAAKIRMQNTLTYTEKILKSLLNTARNEYIATRESLYVRNMLSAIKSRHDDQINQKGLTLRTFSSKDSIICSSVVINRIIDNLINNACCHTTKGGILLSIRNRSNHTLVEVWDTGCGIPSMLLLQISRPYSQLKNDNGEKQGVGMGLYIVKVLCENAGYQFKVLSRENIGSRFSISIPHMLSN